MNSEHSMQLSRCVVLPNNTLEHKSDYAHSLDG
jgi:hypothetical protein